MSGRRYLLDTNAVITLLRGDEVAAQQAASATWIGVSVVTRLELLSFPRLGPQDRATILALLSRIAVIGLDPREEAYLDRITAIRATTKVKLPDAIIAATAVEHDAVLVTAYRQLLGLTKQVEGLRVLDVSSSG